MLVWEEWWASQRSSICCHARDKMHKRRCHSDGRAVDCQNPGWMGQRPRTAVCSPPRFEWDAGGGARTRTWLRKKPQARFFSIWGVLSPLTLNTLAETSWLWCNMPLMRWHLCKCSKGTKIAATSAVKAFYHCAGGLKNMPLEAVLQREIEFFLTQFIVVSWNSSWSFCHLHGTISEMSQDAVC